MPQLADYLFFVTGHWRNWSEPINNALLILLIFMAALTLPSRVWKLAVPLEAFAGRLARHRWFVIMGSGFLAFLANAVISWRGQWPVPGVHDEFSYLLAADTFARGRLANPTPPMWVHLETFHVIFQPTYVSKYPPGEGLMLAIGQFLTGYPIVGSWMGTGFAVAALCWMAYLWLPPRWALVAALLAIMHPAIIFWTQGYWGCQWAIAGSSLALGAFKLIALSPKRNRESVGPGFILGLGIALMIITRPYEGVVLTAALVLAYACILFKKPAARRGAMRAALPAMLLVALTGGWQAYYNYRTTGNPARLAYAVHEEAYGVSPLLIWQKFKPAPHYRHEMLRRFHLEDEPPEYLHHRTPGVMLQVALEKLSRLLVIHCQSMPMAAALLALPFVLKRRRYQLLGAMLLLYGLAVTLEVWVMPHYATPMLPLVFLLGLQGMRHMRIWRWHRKPLGLRLCRALVLLAVLSLPSSALRLAQTGGTPLIYDAPGGREFAVRRAQLAEHLASLPGKDLVLVSYDESHEPGQEWVYNLAEIEEQPVIWARAMRGGEDSEIINYYSQKKRRIWRINPVKNSLNMVEIKSGEVAEDERSAAMKKK